MVISMVFKMIGGLFEGLGKVWAVRIRRYAKFTPLLLIAQTTNNTTVDVSQYTSLITSLIYAILPLFLTILVVSLVFKLFGKIGDIFSRAFYLRKNLYRLAIPLASLTIAQTSTDQAIQVVQQITPLLMTLITILMIIAIPFIVFKALAKGVQELLK
jgi:hypothetical protein